MVHLVHRGNFKMMVTITISEYEALRRDSLLLAALENQGVDNWGGYSDAYQEFSRVMADDEENSVDSSDEWAP